MVCIGASPPAPRPTLTPTPHARLTGGFGRTPLPTPEGGGQSYSDVVRAAADSKARKEQKAPVAITNETLVTDPKKGRITTSSPRNAVPTAMPSPGRPPVSGTPSLPTPTPTGGPTTSGEAEWREKARAARQRVEEGKARVAELERQSKKLENDFYAWDDGQYRDGVIKPSWDKKREELETARREQADAERELTDLPEKARKAGALPGWIRE
jgi:hypothetical protein